MPTAHHNDEKLMDLAKAFCGEQRFPHPALFYLWGHSYEFDQFDNWHVIEEFADYVAQFDQTVWFATNIEIHDYIQAYRQLIYSADAGMIYIAQPPLYRVYKKSDPSKHIYCWDDKQLEEAKAKIGAGYGINRYKGLGEMNASQLAETTMDKKKRVLLQVKIDDPLVVEKRIGILMSKDSSARWNWIQENVTFNDEDKFLEELEGEKRK